MWACVFWLVDIVNELVVLLDDDIVAVSDGVHFLLCYLNSCTIRALRCAFLRRVIIADNDSLMTLFVFCSSYL